MQTINRGHEMGPAQRNQRKFQVGDRIETCNQCLGTVVRVDCDEIGVFIVAQLDTLLGEFAYDPWELDKIID